MHVPCIAAINGLVENNVDGGCPAGQGALQVSSVQNTDLDCLGENPSTNHCPPAAPKKASHSRFSLFYRLNVSDGRPLPYPSLARAVLQPTAATVFSGQQARGRWQEKEAAHSTPAGDTAVDANPAISKDILVLLYGPSNTGTHGVGIFVSCEVVELLRFWTTELTGAVPC